MERDELRRRVKSWAYQNAETLIFMSLMFWITWVLIVVLNNKWLIP